MYTISNWIEIRSVGFCEGRKFGEKPSEQGWEPTTNSTHKWHKGQESNPGHRGVILIVHYTCYILWIHILRQSTSFLGMQTEVAIYFCSRKQNLVKINTHHLERFWFGFLPQNESQQMFSDNNDIDNNDNNSATHKNIILFTLSTLTSNISIYFLCTILFSIPMVVTRRIYLTMESFLN